MAKTQFEIAQEQAAAGQLRTPRVSTSTGVIDYFGYQLSVHKFNMGIMAAGMKCRGITFTQIKKYYGLKGKSAKECKPEMDALVAKYTADLQLRRQQAINN